MILLALLIFLVVYCVACYINFRIVVKFDPKTTMIMNFIPIYNVYLLFKCAFPNSTPFFAVWVVMLVIGKLDGFIGGLATLVSIVIMAYAIGSIAQRLGKSLILFGVLSIIPLVNLVMAAILAFDGSMPVGAAGAAPYVPFQPVPPQSPGAYPAQPSVPPAPPAPPVPPVAAMTPPPPPQAAPPAPPSPPPAPQGGWKHDDSSDNTDGN